MYLEQLDVCDDAQSDQMDCHSKHSVQRYCMTPQNTCSRMHLHIVKPKTKENKELEIENQIILALIVWSMQMRAFLHNILPMGYLQSPQFFLPSYDGGFVLDKYE